MRNVNFAGMIDIFCLYVPEEGTLGDSRDKMQDVFCNRQDLCEFIIMDQNCRRYSCMVLQADNCKDNR